MAWTLSPTGATFDRITTKKPVTKTKTCTTLGPMEPIDNGPLKRMKRFVDITHLPCIPKTAREFEPIIHLMELQLACIHTRLQAIKKWQMLHSPQVDELASPETISAHNVLDVNMKRWFQNFKPHDYAVNDFKSDAGLMLFDENKDVVEAAQAALASLKTVQRKRKLEDDWWVVCPMPLKPRLEEEQRGNQAQDNTCCTPPTPTRKPDTDGAYSTPQERARHLLRNSRV